MKLRIASALALAAAAATTIALTTFGGGPAAIEHGPRDRPWVALTFDADPGGYDASIVAELHRTETPATIFVTGRWAEEHPDVVQALAADPLFELESHSYSHAAFAERCYGLDTLGSEQEKQRELAGADAVLTRLTGISPRYFRFPGGCHRAADLDLVAVSGQVAVQWDVVSGDASERDPAAVARAVVEGVHTGSIVVMHLNGAPNAPATARALARAIPELRERGFRFVRLRELLAPR